jgi:hypothetical protein
MLKNTLYCTHPTQWTLNYLGLWWGGGAQTIQKHKLKHKLYLATNKKQKCHHRLQMFTELQTMVQKELHASKTLTTTVARCRLRIM